MATRVPGRHSRRRDTQGAGSTPPVHTSGCTIPAMVLRVYTTHHGPQGVHHLGYILRVCTTGAIPQGVSYPPWSSGCTMRLMVPL